MNYKFLSELIEIFDGKSGFDFNGQTLFFKHFSLRDQNQINLSYNKYKAIALRKGIELEKDIYDRLKEDKDWTADDDLKIVEQQDYLKNLIRTKASIILPSQKDSHQKLIDEEDKKLFELITKKQDLVGTSAEQYATKMSNEEFIRILIYEDENLTRLKFTQDDFGIVSNEELLEITKSYTEMSSKFNDDSIQHIVLQDFFSMYLSLCENPYNFFGKFLNEMTAYQMKLLLYGKIFYNIFSYNDDIPEYMRKDPKEIFEFVDSKKTRDKFQSQHGDNEATMVFGATSKDLDILDPNAKKMSLNDMLAQNGGSLNMEQMMDLMK